MEKITKNKNKLFLFLIWFLLIIQGSVYASQQGVVIKKEKRWKKVHTKAYDTDNSLKIAVCWTQSSETIVGLTEYNLAKVKEMKLVMNDLLQTQFGRTLSMGIDTIIAYESYTTNGTTFNFNKYCDIGIVVKNDINWVDSDYKIIQGLSLGIGPFNNTDQYNAITLNWVKSRVGWSDYGLMAEHLATIVHEMGHVLGLHHENKKFSKKGYRWIDGKWIYFDNASFCPEKEETVPSIGTTDVSVYDPHSIMNKCRGDIRSQDKPYLSCGDRRSLRYLYGEPKLYNIPDEKTYCSFTECVHKGGSTVGRIQLYKGGNTFEITDEVCDLEDAPNPYVNSWIDDYIDLDEEVEELLYLDGTPPETEETYSTGGGGTYTPISYSQHWSLQPYGNCQEEGARLFRENVTVYTGRQRYKDIYVWSINLASGMNHPVVKIYSKETFRVDLLDKLFSFYTNIEEYSGYSDYIIPIYHGFWRRTRVEENMFPFHDEYEMMVFNEINVHYSGNQCKFVMDEYETIDVGRELNVGDIHGNLYYPPGEGIKCGGCEAAFKAGYIPRNFDDTAEMMLLD